MKYERLKSLALEQNDSSPYRIVSRDWITTIIINHQPLLTQPTITHPTYLGSPLVAIKSVEYDSLALELL
jgi:hypothetical protein